MLANICTVLRMIERRYSRSLRLKLWTISVATKLKTLEWLHSSMAWVRVTSWQMDWIEVSSAMVLR
ncbi:hypothetical protein D3C76_1684920 [compost metagenome]